MSVLQSVNIVFIFRVSVFSFSVHISTSVCLYFFHFQYTSVLKSVCIVFIFSIRLYFGQGECILLRPCSGDMEEMTEIITRLTAVSQGTEVLHTCLVLSCLVLSCLVLPCLALPCLALPCLDLTFPDLSCLDLTWLVLTCLVLSCLVLSCLVLSCLFPVYWAVSVLCSAECHFISHKEWILWILDAAILRFLWYWSCEKVWCLYKCWFRFSKVLHGC